MKFINNYYQVEIVLFYYLCPIMIIIFSVWKLYKNVKYYGTEVVLSVL